MSKMRIWVTFGKYFLVMLTMLGLAAIFGAAVSSLLFNTIPQAFLVGSLLLGLLVCLPFLWSEAKRSGKSTMTNEEFERLSSQSVHDVMERIPSGVLAQMSDDRKEALAVGITRALADNLHVLVEEADVQDVDGAHGRALTASR